ncbi:hypothetical protein C6A85_10250, partial [Mycobacterium sp. ITM-2017-0098]
MRDAILARTADLDTAAWDLLNLLTCAPGAIGDHLLAGLGAGRDHAGHRTPAQVVTERHPAGVPSDQFGLIEGAQRRQ